MTSNRFAVDPITPAVGAWIEGVDLSAVPEPEILDELYDVLTERLVICMPAPGFTPATQLAFARSFGEVDAPHPLYPEAPGFGDIMLLENDAERPPDTNDWHTDLTYRPEPPFASILYSEVIPPTGGDTLWTSMYAAYDALPEAMKSMVADLSAVHDNGSFKNDFAADGQAPSVLAEGMQRMGYAVHPIAPVHPVTGRRYLYVNKSFTRHVLGMSTTQSDRLLAYLLDHVDCPEYQMRLRWKPETLVMWDNRVTQHYAVADYLPAYRRMRRVTIVADRRSGTASDAGAAAQA